MRIIGLAGYPGAGKNEAAEALVKVGWKAVAFADPIRSMLLALDPLVPIPHEEGHRRISYIVRKAGWDWCKRSIPEVRRLLQVLGTECVRDHIGEDTWVELARKKIDEVIIHGRAVITDCRFPQEFEMVKEMGGVLVYIDRPSIEPPTGHASEQNYDKAKFDYVIENTGTVEDLHRNMLSIANGETPF